ncbi:MAG: hypothetical protein IKL55_01255 [Clostridia bacterium]|nr:hypothetical protein [Clostridia bacterium]
MDNIDKEIQKILSKELTPHSSFNRRIISTIHFLENRKSSKCKAFKLSFATICCSLIMVSGLVFADDIINFVKNKFDYRLGEGINTAIENGYIEEPDDDFLNTEAIIEEYEEIKETINLGIKINSFLVDENFGFNTEITFKFDTILNNYLNLFKEINGNYDFENSYALELVDLIILDHNKKIVFLSSDVSEDQFNKFCLDHNLDYSFSDYSNDSYFTKLEGQVENHNKSTNSLKYIFNLNLNEEFSKSESLDFYFTKITFRDKGVWGSDKNQIDNQRYNNLILNGNWTLHFEIPEYMYNHEDIFYEVIGCENDNFEVYEARAHSTGFKLGLKIHNIERIPAPEYPNEFNDRLKEAVKELEDRGEYPGSIGNTREEYVNLLGNEEYVLKYEEYLKKMREYSIVIDDLGLYPKWEHSSNDFTHLKNSNNIRFNKSTLNFNEDYINDSTLDYHPTFEMTKYDATDLITLVIYLADTPYEIKLKMIK